MIMVILAFSMILAGGMRWWWGLVVIVAAVADAAIRAISRRTQEEVAMRQKAAEQGQAAMAEALRRYDEMRKSTRDTLGRTASVEDAPQS